MARGWDRKPPSSPLGQIGQMLKGALGAAQTVLGEGTRAGKAQLDEALLKRRHREHMVALGAAVLRLVQAGRLDAEDFPELAGAIDDALASERGDERAGPDDDDERPPWDRPAKRRGRQDAGDGDQPLDEAHDEDATDRARARASGERRAAPWERAADPDDDPDADS
jgi:hypothetical protein